MLAARIRQLAQDIALTVAPRNGAHGKRVVVSGLPETEAVVMFDCENNLRHTRCFHDTTPLVRVERITGVEHRRVLLAASPFHAGKGIGSKMNESGELVLMMK